MNVEEQNFCEDQEIEPMSNSTEEHFLSEDVSESAEEEISMAGGEDEESSEREGSDGKKINRKQFYDTFLSELELLQTPEEKLRHVIEFMAATLATTQGSPYFKGFWDARTLALQLFKDTPNSPARTELWNKYAELSKEARHLKETLDEQSLFASEQIEIAIKAIENEQENPTAAFEGISGNNLLNECQTLRNEISYYEQTQRELHLLNAHASRITALRKELIRIEMRVRQKNKFFQRLSSAGDKTFPRRKELIKELSQHFSAAVDDFVQKYFSNEEFRESVFFLREEIKLLQAVAKYLTLNTQSFTYTRMRLSECWDKLKSCDKERKKQRAQDKALYKENADLLHVKLSDVEQKLLEALLNNEDAHNSLDDIINQMKQTTLGRDEIRVLRDRLAAIRQAIVDKVKFDEQERLNQIQEKDKLKKFRLQELKNEISSLMLGLESYDALQLTAKRDEIVERINGLAASKMEKQELERLLKPVKDAIVDKKERDILDLSDDDRQAIEHLREILQQRQERRQEIKKQLEILRKNSGSSGLDFVQAMNYNGQVAAEKERLEKISEGIKEIQDKIAEKLKKADAET
ncbi:MAG: hypothetical protein H0T62_12100 [Parachlamydiaceae bacterium]|nr:hypothetical protein [Parachlamydiaceae bacterium]